MFLPIGDAPNPKGTPLVTYALIAVNVAAFLLLNVPLGSQRADVRSPAFREYVETMSRELGGRVDPRDLAAQTSAYDLFTFEHGYRPSAPQLADLLTAMFLHGGLMHLFGNMLFLWIYGDNVEHRLGPLAYLAWYLVTGIAGTLTHAVAFPASDLPLVGASGAISGVLGFYFVWFPRNVVRVLAFLPPFLMQVFQVPARIVLGAYLLIDNLLPFFMAQGRGVAHGAHLGGFVAGAALAWFFDWRRAEAPPSRFAAARPAAPVAAQAPRAAEAVREALARGDHAEAAEAYFALPPALARGALTAEQAVELGSWLRESGHPEAALTLLRRAVRDVTSGSSLAELHALLGTVLLEDFHEPSAAFQYLLTALDLGPRSETAAAVRRSLQAIDALQKRRVGQLRRPAW